MVKTVGRIVILNSDLFSDQFFFQCNSEILSVQQKIKIKPRNAVPNYSEEEKPTQNKTRQPNISIIVSEKTTFDVQTNHFVNLLCYCFPKLVFSAEFHSIPFRASELALPRNSECLGMSAFFRGFWNEIPFRTLPGTEWKPLTSGNMWQVLLYLPSEYILTAPFYSSTLCTL